jgi:DNA-binding NarL/FixJ family response regulator
MKIVVIDSLPVVRSGIQMLLKTQFDGIEIIEYPSFNNYFAMENGSVDIIVFGHSDTTHTAISSYTQKIKQSLGNTKLVVTNSPNDMLVLKKYLTAGVSGYLSESAEVDEFNKCFSNVTRGFRFFNYALIPFMLDYFKTGERSHDGIVPLPVNNFTLGARERQVAQMLSQGISSGNIAIKLNLKPSTVSTIKKIVFKKLNVKNVIELKNNLDI